MADVEKKRDVQIPQGVPEADQTGYLKDIAIHLWVEGDQNGEVKWSHHAKRQPCAGCYPV